VAHACNPAAWRLGCLNGLISGFLGTNEILLGCTNIIETNHLCGKVA